MKQHSRGILMALIAAALWGVSGTSGQFLFQERGVSVEWLISVRMLGAGVLLLIMALLRKDNQVWTIWRNRRERLQLLSFGIFGMLAVQYTYFAAIMHSNAPTATILQFSGPVLIAIYLALRHGQRLHAMGYLAIASGVLGTFLLVTHGDIGTLNISPLAFTLGIASAVSLAIYTLLPGRLLRKYNEMTVIGWGMLIGGAAISFLNPPWNVEGTWDIYTYANTLFIVIFGTLVPFSLYLRAVQLVGGQKASLLTSAEPLSATFIAVLWLGVSFEAMDWLGALLVVATVFLLSAGKKPREV